LLENTDNSYFNIIEFQGKFNGIKLYIERLQQKNVHYKKQIVANELEIKKLKGYE